MAQFFENIASRQTTALAYSNQNDTQQCPTTLLREDHTKEIPSPLGPAVGAIGFANEKKSCHVDSFLMAIDLEGEHQSCICGH